MYTVTNSKLQILKL